MMPELALFIDGQGSLMGEGLAIRPAFLKHLFSSLIL
jgi:hypothetical protein